MNELDLPLENLQVPANEVKLDPPLEILQAPANETPPATTSE